MNDIIAEPIDKDKLSMMLSEYISLKERRYLIVNQELSIKENEIGVYPNIKFYFETFIMGEKIKTYIDEATITKMLSNYATNKGYEYISHKYIGTVRKVGYYTEENIPIVEGILLSLKEKKD